MYGTNDRTFLVSKGASLSKTELTWFYPISMPPVRVNTISDAWDDVANKYFGISKTKRMTESLAPIRFFFTNNATATNLVNIDIGGGTTDIAFAQEQHLKFVTSFKFAAMISMRVLLTRILIMVLLILLNHYTMIY